MEKLTKAFPKKSMIPAIPGDLSQGICICATHICQESRNQLQQAWDSTEKARMLLTSKTQQCWVNCDALHSTQRIVSLRTRPGPSPGCHGLPCPPLAVTTNKPS